MRCLVTGASGFVGSFLVERLCGAGHDVWALVRDPARARQRLPPAAHLLEGAVEEREACSRAVGAAHPEQVYHLAAQSYPQVSWREPQRTVAVNLLGTLHVLEAIRGTCPEAVLVLAGSSAEYAADRDGRPLAETATLDPASPYGISKLAADLTGALYAQRYGARVVRVRPFFFIGPRKTDDVCSDFARGIVRCERTGDPRLRVGNLDIVRDFLDVRDGVEAMVLLAGQGQPGEAYNICRGEGFRLGDVLDRLVALSRARVRPEVDPALLRPVDEPVKVGDPARLMAMGWRPARSLDDSLRDMLDYWRQVPERARA